MSKPTATGRAEIESLDPLYRSGGLLAMASPQVHYDDPHCPHPGCGHLMEWIDFKLELHGDPEGVYGPLASAWCNGIGFASRCPGCGGWVRFATLGMTALADDQAARTLPQLPDHWASVAQFA